MNFATISGGGAPHDVGVEIYGDGRVTNGSATDLIASISAYQVGVAIGAGTIRNFGTVRSTGTTIGHGGVLLGGGILANGSDTDTKALISGYAGVSALSASTILNYGTIDAVSFGVGVFNGGLVKNGSVGDTVALIHTTQTGVAFDARGTFANFGTIDAAQGGVLLDDGGQIINGGLTDSAALIEGASAVLASGTVGAVATVQNFGTIESTGTSGYAVQLAVAGSTLVVEGRLSLHRQGLWGRRDARPGLWRGDDLEHRRR